MDVPLTSLSWASEACNRDSLFSEGWLAVLAESSDPGKPRATSCRTGKNGARRSPELRVSASKRRSVRSGQRRSDLRSERPCLLHLRPEAISPLSRGCPERAAVALHARGRSGRQ